MADKIRVTTRRAKLFAWFFAFYRRMVKEESYGSEQHSTLGNGAGTLQHGDGQGIRRSCHPRRKACERLHGEIQENIDVAVKNGRIALVGDASASPRTPRAWSTPPGATSRLASSTRTFTWKAACSRFPNLRRPRSRTEPAPSLWTRTRSSTCSGSKA